jgi:hypothetical protein
MYGVRASCLTSNQFGHLYSFGVSPLGLHKILDLTRPANTGRIGRIVMRNAILSEGMDVVAVNE